MHFFGLLALAGAAAAATVAYDRGYDDAGRSMLVVSCSDGPKGLAGKYPTQGKLPHFPYIGAVPDIAGWGSANCGSCFALTYEGRTIHIIGIDHGDSYITSFAAMNDLTSGNAEFLGRVQASAVAVDKGLCGL